MQIRVQGRKIQCIRTVYDKEIRRGRQTLVASISRFAKALPSSGLEKLTDAERQSLDEWLAHRRTESEKTHQYIVLQCAEGHLAELARSIENGDENELTCAQAEAIWHGMSVVAKALRKAGYAKPKAARAVGGSVNGSVCQQVDLFGV